MIFRAAAAAGFCWSLMTPNTADAQFAPPTGPSAYPPTVSDPSAGIYDPSGYASMTPEGEFGSDPYASAGIGPDGEFQPDGSNESVPPGVNVFAGPNAGMFSVGASLTSGKGDAVWSDVRDIQVGAYHNDNQTLVNGGGTLGLTYEDRVGLAGRALLGGAINDDRNDAFSFSGDLFAGFKTEFVMEHWFKACVLYDFQEDFSRVGPEIGALFFANGQHPISFDLAIAYGNGDPILAGPSGQIGTATGIADEEVQLRLGTYLTPNLQIGATGIWSDWDNPSYTDYDGYGGFLAVTHNFYQFTFDITTDDEVRCFANLALTTDAFVLKRTRDTETGIVPMVHPRDWLTRAVIRDVAVTTQSVSSLVP